MRIGRDLALRAAAPAAALGVVVTLAACSSSPRPDFASPVPSARIEAIGNASERPGPEELKGLIAQLDSDDPAVRVFAIAALEHATGQRRGYDPADPERLRREAADRWHTWYCQEYGLPVRDDRWKDEHARPAGGQPGNGPTAGRQAPDPHQ